MPRSAHRCLPEAARCGYSGLCFFDAPRSPKRSFIGVACCPDRVLCTCMHSSLQSGVVQAMHRSLCRGLDTYLYRGTASGPDEFCYLWQLLICNLVSCPTRIRVKSMDLPISMSTNRAGDRNPTDGDRGVESLWTVVEEQRQQLREIRELIVGMNLNANNRQLQPDNRVRAEGFARGQPVNKGRPHHHQPDSEDDSEDERDRGYVEDARHTSLVTDWFGGHLRLAVACPMSALFVSFLFFYSASGDVLFFALDPRNLRPGLATDGFNPYSNLSSTYSCWPVLVLRHNLDVMHIEKNVRESILDTLLDINWKTKEEINARIDLQDMGIRQELHPQDRETKTYLPPARIHYPR
ncbi:hypothetical protein Ddye_023067 [Dipteronia dyeriana]|uniref:Uncharacterized protein n=1 Tax=Dipteronia dyeriana TaxID=168575 RepID=A0AAD9TSA9_9ROSI|nr:hypothetical protein Ddye_023067 [Dipteronia dyeriana]